MFDREEDGKVNIAPPDGEDLSRCSKHKNYFGSDFNCDFSLRKNDFTLLVSDVVMSPRYARRRAMVKISFPNVDPALCLCLSLGLSRANTVFSP